MKVDNNNATTTDISIKKEKINGLVQKGPYINGTQITMYVLDASLNQTGKVFNTQITDNKGSFQLSNVTLSSKYVQFSANGFYYNESLGSITSTQLSLNALSDITDVTSININILTHLEKRRVEYLVKNGKTFIEAKKTAQQEIQAIFGIQISQSAVSEKLDIATAGDSNAILLAISLIIQGELSVGDLSELLATISADIEEDGLMNNNSVMSKLRTNAKSLHLDTIRKNLVKRYQDLGVSATIPDFEKYINTFLVQSAEKPSAESKTPRVVLNHSATLTGIVNPNGAETVVTFEYGLTSSYGNSIVAKESPLYGDTSKNVSADIINLDSLTTYHYRIKAENGKGITYSADSIFKTLKYETDILSGLVAYYPFNGNANDESGNGFNGIAKNTKLVIDRFGISNSAYSFADSSFIQADIDESNSPEFNKVYSFSFWINTNGHKESVIIQYKDGTKNSPNNNFDLFYSQSYCSSDYFSFQHYPNSIATCSPEAINFNTWTHIYIEFINSTNLFRAFKNGAFWMEGPTDSTFPGQGIISIGNNVSGQFPFNGLIDDLRIYSRSLSTLEILYLSKH